MNGRHQQKGFTLVELAIVITIIGLLIGGVLKGQALLNQSRVTATITQASTLDTAAQTFYTTYSSLPGDMMNAPSRLPDCALCGVAPDTTAVGNACTSGTDGAGNGVVGSCVWDMNAFQSASYTGSPASGTPGNETVLFWLELSKAGLISGITEDGITSVAASFGGSLPAARIGGGFVAGYASGSGSIPGRLAADNMPEGTVLVLTAYPTALTATAGAQVVSPIMAAQMDRKTDDGLPDSGFVQAYGDATNCHGASYAASNSKDCGVYFRIMHN